MMTTLRGVIHGKTIELSDETGLPEGQEVTVSVHPTSPQPPLRANAAMQAALNTINARQQSMMTIKGKDSGEYLRKAREGAMYGASDDS